MFTKLSPLPCLLLASLTLSACANFGVVEEGKLYRRSQPSEESLSEIIEEYEIKTVLRLRGGAVDDPAFQDSYNAASAHGINFVQIPMSASRFPKKWEIVQLTETLEAGPYPMLIHCRAGADRTGLASALYLLHAGKSMSEARGELTIWYGHLGMFGTQKMEETLDMYEPWRPYLTIAEWAREIYERPKDDDLPDDFAEQTEARIAEWIALNPARAAAAAERQAAESAQPSTPAQPMQPVGQRPPVHSETRLPE